MKNLDVRRCAARLTAVSLMVLPVVTTGLACSKSAPSGGLEVIIATNLRTPDDFDSLQATVRQETSPGMFAAPLFDETKSVPSQLALPSSISVASGNSADELALIVVRGLKAKAAVIERTVQVQIPTDSWLELELFLTADCSNVMCSDTTTCIAGTCQSVVVDRSQLHPYQPGDLEGGTFPINAPCEGGACVDADTSVGGCGLAGQGCCPGSPPCAATACPTASSTGCACVSEGSNCGPVNGPSGTCQRGTCIFGAQGCGPSNCSGCCDSAGNCFPGNSPNACGIAGSFCQTCPPGSTCGGGVCAGPGPCGAIGQACCSNVGNGSGCNNAANCVSGMCVACGQKDQACCNAGTGPAFCNGMNLDCNGSICTSCGGSNEPCCGGNFCQGPGVMCNGTMCVPQCGLEGNACCPYDFCSQGCCEKGTCTAQGATCTVYGGVCANQSCQGSTCGSINQPCCTASDGSRGCTSGNTFCQSGTATCQPCGMPGSGPGANCCPGDSCAGAGTVCSHAAEAGTGGDPDAGYCQWCGGYQQPCCDGDAGTGPGNQGPCQTGYTCTSGTCL